MKAIVLHAIGETPRFEEMPTPIPKEGEVLLKVTAAPLINFDRARAKGSHYSSMEQKLPAICGSFAAGQLPDGKRVLFGNAGGVMAEYAVTKPAWCYPIPDVLDDAQAAAAHNAGISAWMSLLFRAKLQAKERVLVLGATGVAGKLSVQLAKHFGAERVVAVGRNEKSLQSLRELGADAIISLNQSDELLASALKAEAGKGYDVVIDYLWGHPTEVLLQAIANKDTEVRNQRTRLIQVGEMAGSHLSLPAGILRSTGLEILGNGTGIMPPMDTIIGALGELLTLLASQKLRLDTKRVPFAQVGEYWDIDQGGSRVVFVP
jgi:NADPH:quinone reductase-like Zn-dependent oxidoreductase